MSVLVLGLPRAGTTWVAEMLAGTPGARYVHEPDNEHNGVEAAYAKRALGRFPMLRPGDEAPAYARLWRRAFAGPPRGVIRRLDHWDHGRAAGPLHTRRSAPLGWLAQRIPRLPDEARPVVKSVHAALCAEWVAAAAEPDHVVVLLRDPLNVVASMIELEMPDADRRLDEGGRIEPPLALPTRLHRMAWQVAVLEEALLSAAARNPDWTVERHESLMADPLERFPSLAAAVGLEWPDECHRRLLASNAAGSGYRTTRRWSDLRERWRRTLGDEQAEVVRGVVERTQASAAKASAGQPLAPTGEPATLPPLGR